MAMCIKHIELWKQLLIDAEIPVREESIEGQSKKGSGAGVAYLASNSGGIQLGSPSGAARGGASGNFSRGASNHISRVVSNNFVSANALKIAEE